MKNLIYKCECEHATGYLEFVEDEDGAWVLITDLPTKAGLWEWIKSYFKGQHVSHAEILLNKKKIKQTIRFLQHCLDNENHLTNKKK